MLILIVINLFRCIIRSASKTRDLQPQTRPSLLLCLHALRIPIILSAIQLSYIVH